MIDEAPKRQIIQTLCERYVIIYFDQFHNLVGTTFLKFIKVR